MDIKTGIYKITNKINGKSYIGKSVDIYRRWENEKHFVSVNKHLKSAFKKYGFDNFSFEILEECEKEKLDEKEIYYISLFDVINKEKGYNMTFGGTGGKLTDEAVEKMKKTKKEKGYTKYWLNKKIPDDIREKISKNISGEKNPFFNKKGKNSPNHKIVKCIELNKIFNSLKEAAEFVNIKAPNNISNAILREGTAGGYHWKYVLEKPKIKNITTGEVFNSVKEAAQKYNLEKCLSAIHKACKGQRKTCGGFEWCYIF